MNKEKFIEKLRESKNKYLNSRIDSNDDFKTMTELKKDVKAALEKNQELDKPLFDRIISWKLRTQEKRTDDKREPITEDIVKIITHAVFLIKGKDDNETTNIKLRVMRSLPGIGIPVASAFLAFMYPKTYGIIDRINWKEVFGENKTTFTFKDYRNYLNELNYYAKEIDCTVQETDYIIWKTGINK